MDVKYQYSFSDTKNLTKIVMILLSLSFISTLIDAYYQLQEVEIWQKLKNGIITEKEAIATVDQLWNVYNSLYNGYVALVLYFLTMIFVLIWIYKANKNSHALGAIKMKYSPFGSIGWYFVPIFNYFKPYKAMIEIYQTSITNKKWEEEPVSRYIWLWWISWVLFWVSILQAFKISVKSINNDYVNIAGPMFLSDIFYLISTIFFILLIKDIYHHQINNYKKNEK